MYTRVAKVVATAGALIARKKEEVSANIHPRSYSSPSSLSLPNESCMCPVLVRRKKEGSSMTTVEGSSCIEPQKKERRDFCRCKE